MRLFAWWLRRALSGLGTLLGVSVLIFAAVRLMPGGFAQTILGPFATAAQKAGLAARYGLDQPIVVQYVRWLGAIGGGDFGASMISHVPVTAELAARLPVTGRLALYAVLIALVVGVPLGISSALRGRGGVTGRLLSGLGVSVPDFALGSLVVFVLSRSGLAVDGYLIPAAVLALFAVSITARTTRDAVMGVLVEPHVTAAVARGRTPWFVIRHHVLRNAAPPVLTLLGTVVAYLLGGALVVEYVFNLPGIGAYVVQAVARRDYAVVQAGVLLAAVAFIVVNILIDLVVGVLDPRLSGRRA